MLATNEAYKQFEKEVLEGYISEESDILKAVTAEYDEHVESLPKKKTALDYASCESRAIKYCRMFLKEPFGSPLTASGLSRYRYAKLYFSLLKKRPVKPVYFQDGRPLKNGAFMIAHRKLNDKPEYAVLAVRVEDVRDKYVTWIMTVDSGTVNGHYYTDLQIALNDFYART